MYMYIYILYMLYIYKLYIYINIFKTVVPYSLFHKYTPLQCISVNTI